MNEAQTTLVELSEALQDFASSPRFNFLKALQVGRFVEGGAPSLGVLSEFTFEKLVEIGTKKLSKLRWLNRGQESQLVTLLRALTEGSNNEQVPPPPGRPLDSRHQLRHDEHHEDVVSSVQVEIDLRESLQRLRIHPDFERLRFCTLGEFWDLAWPRAPFEESFTLEQLLEIDLATLFRKRTMTPSRINCMRRSLDRALGSRIDTQSTSAPEMGKSKSAALSKGANSAHLFHGSEGSSKEWEAWVARAVDLEPQERAVLEHFASACSRAANSHNRLESCVARIYEHISAHDILQLLSAKKLSRDLTKTCEKWRSIPEVAERLRGFGMMLDGPGVSCSWLSDAGFSTCFTGANGLIAAQILARTLGAQEVSYHGQVCKGFWTRNPELVNLIMGKVGDDRRSRAIKQAISQLCPSMDPILQSWLCGVLKPSKGKKAPKKAAIRR